ncbi:Rab-GAP TBC domain-containing protein [Pseudozyma hubeiensis]|nr:Rab-GAP TBC domain-containing protein [Pseudozyma hubeiensis]
MAKKGGKAAAAAAASKRTSKTAKSEPEPEPAPSTAQPSLADELADAANDATTHDGYESSTHTDNDDFEDAADGSHADEMTPSSSIATTIDASLQQQPDPKHDQDLSNERTADQLPARRPSLLAHESEALVHTPKPTDTVFPEPSPSSESIVADGGARTSMAASSSTATFVAPASTAEDQQSTPLSSAEIRESRSASDSLILDEESAKATLPEHVEKVPPSVGATSLLEPDETISNPFASGDDSASQPIRYSQSATGDAPSASANQPPDTPSMNSNHFSTISLGSTLASGSGAVEDDAVRTATDRRDSRRDTITTNGARSSLAAEAARSNDSHPAARNNGSSDDSRSNYDFLLARLNTQNKRLSGDPQQMRASIDGAVKLRENFEKLRDQGQRHSRTDSQNRSVAEQGSSSNDSKASGSSLMSPSVDSPAPANDGGESSASAAARESLLSTSADTAYTGPPADDLTESDIDWEFWGEVMSNYQSVARNHPRQLSRAIQAGIPSALRGMMWQLMSSSKDEEMEIIYAYYLKQTSPHEKAIRRDLNRTFPEQDYFQDGKGIGQENLFNVIKAYSLYDPEVGYCQGMQFVVGPLLLNMPDEEAFSTFVRLMKSYDLRGHFTPNMPALQLRLFQFDRLLEDFLPLLHRHLVRQGVKSSMYASQWFMTLFSYRFPLEFVYRVLDSVFAEGVEALFRFAVSLMKRNEEVMLGMGFDEVVKYLKGELFGCYRREVDGDTTVDGVEHGYHTNAFVRDAFEVRITPFQLDTYAGEFDTQVRAANAHRREVEALRLVNRNLSARVKALEDQLTSLNAEHVDMVKDVVMAKIAKEEMAEELVKYKMMYAEAVLAADQESGNNRSSAKGIALQRQRQVEERSRDSGSSGTGI